MALQKNSDLCPVVIWICSIIAIDGQYEHIRISNLNSFVSTDSETEEYVDHQQRCSSKFKTGKGKTGCIESTYLMTTSQLDEVK